MWECNKCRSEVDDDFGVCWNCGTSREGIEDPDFRPADEYEPIVDEALDLDRAASDGLGADLAEPLPDVVECYRADNVTEAKFIADRLMEAGIPAVSDNVNMNYLLGGWQPTLWGSGPRIHVRPVDLPRAMQWIEVYKVRKRDRAHGKSEYEPNDD